MLNPESLNHFVVYTNKPGLSLLGAPNEPSIYRTCFADKGLSVSQGQTINAKQGTCMTLDSNNPASTPFCPDSSKYSSCIALAKSDAIDNLKGYTLFLGLNQKYSDANDLNLFSSLFNSYTKPVPSSQYSVYRRTSQIPNTLLDSTPNGAFTFISG